MYHYITSLCIYYVSSKDSLCENHNFSRTPCRSFYDIWQVFRALRYTRVYHLRRTLSGDSPARLLKSSARRKGGDKNETPINNRINRSREGTFEALFAKTIPRSQNVETNIRLMKLYIRIVKRGVKQVRNGPHNYASLIFQSEEIPQVHFGA